MKNLQMLPQNLRRINYFYNKRLVKELAAVKLNQHFEILLLLAQLEQPVTKNQLARLLQVDKSRIAIIIFSLEKSNMVIVKPGETDRRQHFVSLSPAAKELIPNIETKIKQVNEVANTGISEEKLNIFLEVSEMMMKNLHGSKPTT